MYMTYRLKFLSTLAKTNLDLTLEQGFGVLCEKPLAPTRLAAARLFDIAERRGCVLVENQNYRFNDEIRELSALVDRGAIGHVCEVEVRIALTVAGAGDPSHGIHRLPGGAVHDVLTHLAYLLDQLSGRAEWTDCHGIWSGHLGGEQGLVDDLDAVLVGSAGGHPMHGHLRCSPLSAPEALEVTVRGERGEISAELFQPRLLVRRDNWAGPQLGPVVDHLVNGASMMRSGITNLGRKLVGRGGRDFDPRDA